MAPRPARALLLLASLALGVSLAELASRRVMAWSGREPILRRDGELGWRPRAGLRDHLRVEALGSYRLSTDRRGRRLTRPAGEAPPASAPAVLLVGDSFVFGQGVADDETFAWRLADILDRPVFNLGVPGYGPDQSLLRFLRFAARQPATPVGDVVVLAFENDLAEVQQDRQPYLAMRKPRVEVRGASLQFVPFETAGWERLLARSTTLRLIAARGAWLRRSRPPEPAGGVEAAVAALRDICRLADRRETRCHLLAHRQRPEYRAPDAVWRRFLERSGAEDVTAGRGGAADRTVLGYDGLHWNAAGHERLARILADRLASGGDEPAGAAERETRAGI